MPVPLTFPGVYVEEIKSGVHTITGVATSITAFVGRTERGPVDKPTTITSLGDFVRLFGQTDTTVGQAVQDFYLNGGSRAVIVRLYHAGAGATFATLAPGTLPLRAWTQGVWANALVAIVDLDVDASAASDLGVAKNDLFNLTIVEAVDANAAARIAAAPTKIAAADVAQSEKIRNLTVIESPRRFDRTLRAESNLVRSSVPDPYTPPAMPTAGAVAATPAVADTDLVPADFFPAATPNSGIPALDRTDLFNILCIPPYDASGEISGNLYDQAASYCELHRAMLIVDSPGLWKDAQTAADAMSTGAGVGTTSKNAALFFPRYTRSGKTNLSICGAVAGIFARTDTDRGVWKAPAGLEATVLGITELSVHLTDAENGLLNPLGVNCLRDFPAYGRVVWGSRTLQGDDRLGSEWKYIPVRRTALFIEESLFRGTKWIVFEPNDEPLWAQIRLNIGAFMNSLFRLGAFKGKSPRDAYFVKCDKETTTQNDIDKGIVNIVVGFAPLKPAEFVIISIQQIAGQNQA
jgi:phage tail sheath protein FI